MPEIPSKTTKPPKAKPASKAKMVPPKGEVVYPHLKAVWYLAKGGDESPIDVHEAKRLLGWETEDEYRERCSKEKPHAKLADFSFGTDYVLTDEAGKKVRFNNNARNRPFSEKDARGYAQDILNRYWADSRNSEKGEELTPNGETIIIGRYGNTVSGQHRLAGLILAYQIWAGKQKGHWVHLWEEAPSIEALVVFGVDESPKTIRTLDNVRARTLSDVLYTEELFNKLKMKDRKTIVKHLANSVTFLWYRTGWVNDKINPFGSKQTHSESLEFLSRHDRLKRAIKHVWDEDGGEKPNRNLSKYIPLGRAAALLYLMGSSESDGDEYRNMDPPSEKKLDWSMWDKACDFFTCIAGSSPDVKAVFKKFEELNAEGEPSGAERLAVIVKAWNAFAGKGKVDLRDLELEYQPDQDGIKQLIECPNVGGIDLGDPYEDGEDGPGENDPTPEEIEKLKKEAQAAAAAKGGKRGAAAAAKATTNGKPVAASAPAKKPSTKPTPPPVADDAADENGIPPAVDYGTDEDFTTGDEPSVTEETPAGAPTE